jgi:chemosensory pili system protein ChpA (sensor histidine kinase/response regulator)
VATESTPEFDLGPLSWVQAEIDQALARGLESLAAFRAKPDDSAAVKHARTHVHQAAGAIQMVGLDAVVAYTDELERQLTRLEELPAADVPAACDLVERGCRKLRIFLDEIVNGAPPLPLKLYPEYEAMQGARGVKATPTDLFYPDLSPRAPRIAPRELVSVPKLPSYLVKQRRHYQRGLLSWLRGINEHEGAQQMRDAVAGIEDVTQQSSLRAFWWTSGALLEALVEGGLDSGFGVKQLAARIDLQIRRVAEGSAKVSDRLRREVLYFVAISAPMGPQVQAVQRAFGLTGLIPSAEVLSADVVRLQPILREARDLLAGAKDAWLKAASGRAENLPKLKATMATVHARAAEVHDGALMKLTSALVDRLGKMPASGVAEPVAMEFATALLLAESAFENYTALAPDFPKQVDAMIARLDAARAGRTVAGAPAPMLDEMGKRAAERVLIAQVGREIQANLRHMEQVLDAFFRDNGKRADLASLSKDSQQIRGALRMLGLDDADRLLALCQQQVESYADPEAPVSSEDLELLAESLSGLGFYIEAVEQQRPDRERLIAPLIARRIGEAPAPAPPEEPESVEAAVEELRTALPQLVEEVQRAPADSSAREDLRQKLTGLRDDAELIGDRALAEQTSSMLKELASGDTDTLAATVEALADTAAPTPEISEETARLLATDATGLDGELLDIFLEEAAEVLDTIAFNHRALQGNPGDREALHTVRRGFHTLKGSGRMVGLTQLGELAYDVEKIHNRLLEEERPVTSAVVAMIGVAQTSFRSWIDELTKTGRVTANPEALFAALAAVERELPGAVRAKAPAATPSNVIELPLAHTGKDAQNAAPANPPAPGALPTSPPTLELVELPELGSADDDAPDMAFEPLDSEDIELLDIVVPDEIATPPILRLVETSPPPTVAEQETQASVAAETSEHEPESPPSAATAEPSVAPSEADVVDVVALDEASPVEEVAVFDLPTDIPEEGAWGESPAMTDAVPAESVPEVVTTMFAAQAEVEMSDDIVIGGVTLSLSLWTILCDEADLHLATLQHELEILQFDPVAVPSAEMVRAAHTLCGIHRTGGFPLVADTAKAVEQVLIALEQRGAPLPGSALPVLAHAVSALVHFCGRVKSRSEFTPADRDETRIILDEIDDLRAQAAADASDAESEAEELARRDDDRAPTLALVSAAPPAPADGSPVAGDDDREAPAPLHSAPALEPAAATDIPLPEPAPDPLAGIRDDVDAQVLPIFLEEAAELFPQAGEDLRAWRRDPHLTHPPASLRRTLHTFKGSARMAGAMRLGELAHLMESRLTMGDANVSASSELFDALESDLDQIAFVLDQLRAGKTDVPLPGTAVDVVEATTTAPEATSMETAEPAAPERPVVVAMPLPPALAAPPAPAAVAAAVPVPPRAEATPELETGAKAHLRVRADTIDRLVNEAGEVAIARARVEGDLRALKANLLELTSSVIRLRGQMREIEIQAESQIQSQMSIRQELASEFDPLEFDRYTRFQELTRSLAEGINDVSTVQQSLLKNLDDATAALAAQARLSRDVQQRLFAIRTVPFASLSERLYRIMRTTAKELDKRANLEIHGAQVELDRSVLEKLVGPLEHLLRNALDHGLESRDVRAAAGKRETGEVALTVRQVGNEVVIELADDGAGVDFARVVERARALGLLAADATPTDAQLVECLFKPGFSTASKVTQISGRGIGMDVVRSEIAALGGRVELATRAGEGTRFTLTLPLTLAVAQAVLIRAGGRLWALPAPMVEQVQQVKADVLLDLYVRRRMTWQGRDYPFHYLPRLLGDTTHNPETVRYNSVLLLRSGQSYAAVHVDEMVGNQEVVVKNIGPQLARVSGISGATVLGTGEIVLIINPVQLAARADLPVYDPAADERVVGERPRAPVAPIATLPLVMIVDDSLTVRKITSRLLAREGFAVITAKDGIDALQVLGEQTPDVILLDIEMPRMDGFEFAKTVKGNPKTADIPIVMITSRTAEKHRSRAAELGVDLYLGKPYQEEELLRNLREMLSLPTPA